MLIVPRFGTPIAVCCSRTLLAWLYKMEPNRAKFVSKYGVDFYEGFRLFYALCAKAFAANHGALYMCGYYTFVKR